MDHGGRQPPCPQQVRPGGRPDHVGHLRHARLPRWLITCPGSSHLHDVNLLCLQGFSSPKALCMSVPSRTLEHMFENTAATDPVGFLAAVTELLAKLPSELWRTGNDGFAGIAAAVDTLAVQLDCTRVGLVQEAESRGVVSESSSASSTDWLLAHSDHLEPADAARTVDVARLCGLPKNQVMAAAVAGGTLTVRKAMTALRQLGQVEHALAPGKREEALASLTLMAQTGYDRHVIAVGRTLMALVGADRSLEHNEAALRSLSSLKLCPLANGMVAIRGQLDPESGAVLTAALG